MQWTTNHIKGKAQKGTKFSRTTLAQFCLSNQNPVQLKGTRINGGEIRKSVKTELMEGEKERRESFALVENFLRAPMFKTIHCMTV